jgi:hypothetical protein
MGEMVIRLLKTTWFQITLIYVGSRLITTAMIFFAMTFPGQIGLENPLSGLIAFSSTWDGGWYQSISVNWYPTHIDLDQAGHALENNWAFLPMFPIVVNLYTTVLGLNWSTAAVFISVVCGLVTAQLLFKILENHISRSQSLFAVALFCVAPTSPILQMGYAESLFLMLIASFILFVQKKKFFQSLPIILILGFTKPGVLAVSLMLTLLWIYRMVRRKSDGFPLRESAGIIAGAAVAGIAGLSWTIIAGVATGIPDAYLQTELTWRAPYIGWTSLVPFSPWPQSFSWWSQHFGVPVIIGYIALVIVLAASVIALLSRPMKKLGIEIKLWLLSFGLYVLAVFFPQSSTFRILMPLFPGLGLLSQPQSRLYRTLLLLAFLVGQWLWIYVCWIPHFPVDGTPP